MDELQYAFGDGPCLTAARTHETVSVVDVREEERWPGYLADVAKDGVPSILAVPILLAGVPSCGLNLYSATPVAFDDSAVEAAGHFAREGARHQAP